MPVVYGIFTFLHMWLRVIVFAKLQYNTFTVEQYRSTPHYPRVIDKTCLLNPDSGPCRGEISMFYYNPRERSCFEFDWGGCQGNGNRFDSKEECLNRCLSKPNEPKHTRKWCQLTFDYGYCFGEVKRWYYDRLWQVCKETIYSGCGGNKNNFYNEEQCEANCRFGNGIIQNVKRKSTNKKVLIINPEGATSSRGRNQMITKKTENIIL